jgi:hypothetical protein
MNANSEEEKGMCDNTVQFLLSPSPNISDIREYFHLHLCPVFTLPVFPYNNAPLHNSTSLHTKLDQNIVLKLVPNHPGIHFKTQGTL